MINKDNMVVAARPGVLSQLVHAYTSLIAVRTTYLNDTQLFTIMGPPIDRLKRMLEEELNEVPE